MSQPDCQLQPSPEGAAAPAPAPVVLSFDIPDDDKVAFSRLPESGARPVRSTTLLRLQAVKAIHQAQNKQAAIREVAQKFGSSRGFKPGTLRRLYYAYVETGDWRVLVDRARAGQAWQDACGADLPEAFKDEWKRRVECNQRKCAPAHRKLVADWRRWRAGDRGAVIPGYNRPPDPDPDTGLPSGWSKRNLYRLQPSRIELAAARIGVVAASARRLPVLTTREGLSVGEFILFDDHEFNLKVNYPGQTRAMRPMMFCALDLLSACNFEHGFRPTLWDDQAEKKDRLKEDEFRWFVIHVLLTHGYRADDRGTTFIVEHGTAAIRSEFEERIRRATKDRVRVERSGKFFAVKGEGAPSILQGMFPGRPRGNFRFKGWLESLFNLVDNDLAALPGQVGKDRDHSPEELHGRDLYNNKLLAAAALLPPQAAAALRMPFLAWDEFIPRALDILKAIAWRADHDLEGWRKCGHFKDEWRLNEQGMTKPSPTLLALPSDQQAAALAAIEEAAAGWRPVEELDRLPDCERAAIEALIRSNPRLSRTRPMRPAEVWQAGRTELKRLSLLELPDLCEPSDAIACVVRNAMFHVERQDLGGALDFLAVCRGQQLEDGQKFDLWINPFSPDRAVVTDAHGCVLGVAPRYDRAPRNDGEAIGRLLGQARAWESQALEGLRHRHRDKARDRAATHAHNAGVIDAHNGRAEECGTTTEDRKSRREQFAAQAEAARKLREMQETSNTEDETWETQTP